MTVCYRLVRLVARRALPRHVPVARHFKLVVPGVRADDLASPGGEARSAIQGLSLTSAHYQGACEILQRRFGHPEAERIIFSLGKSG